MYKQLIEDSALISALEYDADKKELTIYFKKYYTDKLTYEKVSHFIFEEFLNYSSKGKFYLHYIKKQFKQKNMAEKPKTVNQSSPEKRFIDISIDVKKINKDWLFEGEKGTYLHMTLQMLPDGLIDGYGNLGMVTQKVPKKVWDDEKSLPVAEKSRGAILGNAAEFERKKASSEGAPGTEAGTMVSELTEPLEDLPF